jgi:hypothetical protein
MKVTLARSVELLTELAILIIICCHETMENVWDFIHNYEKQTK